MVCNHHGTDNMQTVCIGVQLGPRSWSSIELVKGGSGGGVIVSYQTAQQSVERIELETGNCRSASRQSRVLRCGDTSS
jgi:hypothetical protein